MRSQKYWKILVYLFVGLALFVLVILKLVSRLVSLVGYSAPCPASLSWLVDNPLRQAYMRPVLDWIDIQRGETVLELGPGPGAFTIPVARRLGTAGKLIAVDIQPEMIAQVESRVIEAGLDNVETHIAGAYQLPMGDNEVDRAFLITVLPEIQDRRKALAELKRVLKPGGILSITEEFLDPDYLFVPETKRLLASAGFVFATRAGGLWRYTLNFRNE